MTWRIDVAVVDLEPAQGMHSQAQPLESTTVIGIASLACRNKIVLNQPGVASGVWLDSKRPERSRITNPRLRNQTR
jgi:hypothetical protein